MTLEKLATRYNVLERSDKSEFQRKARVLQSIWREAQGLPSGMHRGRTLGSRLPMPEAEANLWNFLSENVKSVVRAEVLDPAQRRGKLYGRPRIFNDLLSSQPLCFNLFAELRLDLHLATAVLRGISDGRVHEVTGIEFEHSPGRGDACYLGDRSAFDIFVQFQTRAGGRGFVGIEVKYHENLLGSAALKGDRYDEVASGMECFRLGERHRLCKHPLQQVWRDHLLAGVMRKVDAYDDGYLLLLYPEQNLHCSAAVGGYRSCLASNDSFMAVTLELLVAEVRRHTDAVWMQRFHDRYLAFEKIDRLLEVGDRDDTPDSAIAHSSGIVTGSKEVDEQ